MDVLDLEEHIYDTFHDWLKTFTNEEIYWDGSRASVASGPFLSVRVFRLKPTSRHAVYNYTELEDTQAKNYVLDLSLTAYGVGSLSRLTRISQAFDHPILRDNLVKLGFGLMNHTDILDTSVQRNMQGTEKRAQMVAKFNVVLEASTAEDDPLNSDIIEEVSFDPEYVKC